MLEVFLNGATALSITLLGLWFCSVLTGKVSFIDAFWGTGFIVVAGAAALKLPELGERQMLALGLLTLWGARLSLYLLKRFLTHGEDQRYVRMTAGKKGLARHFFTGWFVFGLQGVLILIISAPLIALLAAPPAAIGLWAFVGAGVWIVGAFFEWVGDYQLTKFKSDPANQGKVLDSGLWAWTRHPNYFGDACVWWGLWLISGELLTFFAPALMTFLLMKWSGVPLLEKSLKKRRPDYAAYIERTSGFFPRPPDRP